MRIRRKKTVGDKPARAWLEIIVQGVFEESISIFEGLKRANRYSHSKFYLALYKGLLANHSEWLMNDSDVIISNTEYHPYLRAGRGIMEYLASTLALEIMSHFDDVDPVWLSRFRIEEEGGIHENKRRL